MYGFASSFTENKRDAEAQPYKMYGPQPLVIGSQPSARRFSQKGLRRYPYASLRLGASTVRIVFEPVDRQAKAYPTKASPPGTISDFQVSIETNHPFPASI
jgi:hypothetical protein